MAVNPSSALHSFPEAALDAPVRATGPQMAVNPSPALHGFPEAALDAPVRATGPQTAVNPSPALHSFPEAALTRLSGLRSSDGGEPVARPSAAPPGKADDASA